MGSFTHCVIREQKPDQHNITEQAAKLMGMKEGSERCLFIPISAAILSLVGNIEEIGRAA